MSDIVALEDVDITGIEEYPADRSIKLNGPPGTGKTTESAARVAKLMDNYEYTLQDLLWGTYRHSLAMDTLDRLNAWGIIDDGEMADPTEGPTRYISTMHAVANRLVGGAGEPATYGDKKAFAESLGLRYDKRNAWDEPPGQLLFEVFDYAANNLLDIHDFSDRQQIPMLDDLEEQYPGDVGNAWDEWQDYKAEEEKIDFWEQLRAPLEQGVTPQQTIVVVDEYHDATPLLAKLSRQWIDHAEVAIVAGDPLQAVNTYAGARPRFYESLELPEVLLDTTHRVPEEHWAVATSVLSEAHPPPPVTRKKTGTFHEGESPTFSYSDETGWSVPAPDTPRSPAWLIEEFGTDTMFLTRTRKQADGVAYALEKAGILYETQRSMNKDGWGAQEGMSERTALYNALQRLDGVGRSAENGHGLDRFTDGADTTPEDVVLRSRVASALLDHAQAQHLDGSRDDITETANRIDVDETPVRGPEFAEYVNPGFWDTYTRGHGSVRHLNATASTTEGSRISDRDREALDAALRRNDEPVLTVDTKVYTIHASKGSEAENVVVYDGITERIAESMRLVDREWRNEYRTWYVALTRSAANLFVLRGGFAWTQPFLPQNVIATARDAHDTGVNA